MLTAIDRINELLPHASESVLQQVWMILSSAANNGESSEPVTNVVIKHSAFLNGYVPEDEGLYDDY
jgi:hypothetical protein